MIHTHYKKLGNTFQLYVFQMISSFRLVHFTILIHCQNFKFQHTDFRRMIYIFLREPDVVDQSDTVVR